MLLFEHLQKGVLLIQLLKAHDFVVYGLLEVLEFSESVLGEVLRWGSVVLHALKVANDLLGVAFLFVDDLLEHVELLVDLFGDLFFEALLVEDSLLHFLALNQIFVATLVNFLKLGYVLIRSHLQSEGLAPVGLVLEEAIVTQGGVLGRRIDGKAVSVLAKLDLGVLH